MGHPPAAPVLDFTPVSDFRFSGLLARPASVRRQTPPSPRSLGRVGHGTRLDTRAIAFTGSDPLPVSRKINTEAQAAIDAHFQ